MTPRDASSPSQLAKTRPEDLIIATVPVGERGRARSKMFVDMLFSIVDSALAGVRRTCRDKRVVNGIVSEAFMFAHVWDCQSRRLQRAHNKVLVGDEGLEDTSVFIAC